MYENQEQAWQGKHTGAPLPPLPERKSPATAAVLSLLPGLGQVYVGYYQRGFVNITVVASVIFLLAQWEFDAMQPLLGMFLPFFWIYNMIDAARCAQAVNRGADAGMSQELPELPAAVGGGGAFAGALLVGLGLLMLGRTVLGISLAWLAEWWPAGLVVLGARMIWNGRRGRHHRGPAD